MIDIDLADPDAPASPPPAHLLTPVWLFAVLMPLALTALLHGRTAVIAPATLALQLRIDAAAQVARRRAADEELRAVRRHEAAAAAHLRRVFVGHVDRLHDLLMQVPTGVRLEEVRLSGREVSATGSSESAGAVSDWLAAAGASGRVAWSAPELRQAGGRERVVFTVRGRPAEPAH